MSKPDNQSLQPQDAVPLTAAELAELTASIEHLSGPDAWDEDRLEPALIPVTHYVPRLLAALAKGQPQDDGGVRAVAAVLELGNVSFHDAWRTDYNDARSELEARFADRIAALKAHDGKEGKR